VYEINEEVGEVDEGKAACPAQPLTTGDVDPLAHAQTMGICDGASMHAGMTDNERTIRGLMNLQDEARGMADGTLPHVHALRYTHEELLETFNPWFFAIAYPFLYPRGGGWVDYYRNPSSRRSAPTPTDGDDEARDPEKVEQERMVEEAAAEERERARGAGGAHGIHDGTFLRGAPDGRPYGLRSCKVRSGGALIGRRSPVNAATGSPPGARSRNPNGGSTVAAALR
jgi:hypothetical protein